MDGKSASLLTKTQRNRIRDNFGDLAEEKKRRDQQRIRERVRSGFLDFQLLVDYPDRQFALMFDDVPDDDLRAALADTTIVIERLREQREIDRDELIAEVRTHIERCSDPTADTRTLARIDLRTAPEIRRQTEDALADRFGPGLWEIRANGLMKLGVCLSILVAMIVVADTTVADDLIQTTLYIPFVGLMLLLHMTAAGWIAINTAQSLKYNIAPFAVKLIRNPKTTIEETIMQVIKSPRETVRASWEEL